MLKLITKEVKHVIEYEGAEFVVVPNTKEEHKALVEKHTFFKKVVKSSEEDPEYVEMTDFLGLMIDRIDAQVKGWSGIDGNPKCTSENKKALANKKENQHICDHLIEEIDKIGKAAKNKKESEAKN